MSGQQVGSVVGGVVGAVIGAYVGAPQIGYAIGSAIGGAIGGYVDPTIIKGPRLTDAMAQTSSDGVPIPWGLGTFPTAGNIIWTSTLRERKKEDDGKGSGTVQVTYHYYRDYAISICQGVRQVDGTYLPIAGILQVKRNGKVVYDVTPGVSGEQQAANSKFLRDHRFYLGSEDQLPDSVIEMHEGVGDTPAYPGIVYMVAENVELTELQGAIPQYEFVVSICGDVTETPSTHSEWTSVIVPFLTSGSLLDSGDGDDWSRNPYQEEMAGGDIVGDASSKLYKGPSGDVFYSAVGASTGVNFAHRAPAQAEWDFVEAPDISFDGGVMAAAGQYWHVCGGAGFPIYRMVVGSNWESVETSPLNVTNICAFGGSLVAFDFQGTSILPYVADGDGSVWESGTSFSCPFISDGALSSVATGFGEICVVASSNVYYPTPPVAVYRSIDGAAYIPVGSVFPTDWEQTEAHTRPQVVYSEGQHKWVIIVNKRVAVGSSLGAMTLTDFEFPDQVYGLDQDGVRFVAVGNFGHMVSYDGVAWSSAQNEWAGRAVLALSERDAGIPITDAPGYYIQGGVIVGGSTELDRCKPTLAEIVTEACLRAGLSEDDFDVSELSDEVDGFKVAVETSGEAIIGPLMQGFFFDAGEWDDKIRFVKRGGDVVAELTADDCCESDGDVIEEVELQEAELLRKVHVKTIDPAAGYIVTTQTAERRTSTVRAKGEQTTEIAVVTDKDTQARMADKKLKVGWGETRRFKTAIPYTRPELTVTDRIGLTDLKGHRHRVRLMEMAEDSGRIAIDEAMLDRQSSYTSNVEGVSHLPPTTVPSGLIGPTYGWVANLPRLRSADMGPGVYLAACGFLPGWNGCTVLLSVDGGTTYQQVTVFDDPSSMGVLTADISASSEPIEVFMRSGALSSISADQLSLRMNAFAITTGGISELGQFQTAQMGSDGIYDLTNTVRGALGTQASAHYEGNPFVMAASTQFLPLDISLAGRTIYFKFVSNGTSADDADLIPFLFNPTFFGAPVIETYTDDAGNVYTDDAGNTYFYESQ